MDGHWRSSRDKRQFCSIRLSHRRFLYKSFVPSDDRSPFRCEEVSTGIHQEERANCPCALRTSSETTLSSFYQYPLFRDLMISTSEDQHLASVNVRSVCCATSFAWPILDTSSRCARVLELRFSVKHLKTKEKPPRINSLAESRVQVVSAIFNLGKASEC